MPRKVRIATTALLHQGGPTAEDNLRRAAALIDQALAEKPDILALPEVFTLAGLAAREIAPHIAQVTEATLEMASAAARRKRAYIICPVLVAREGGLFNEAVLLDRRGEIAGSYQKIHPVVDGSAFSRLEWDSMPGSRAPVFETDFGRIGMQICFDLNFPDGWQALDRGGAEIFFWLSAYDGGRHLEAMAWQYHRFVVSAVATTYARVVNPMGERLAMTGVHDPVVACTIDLDYALVHTDFNKTQIPLIREKYGPDVTMRVYHEEGILTLQSNREGLDTAQIVREFHLDPLDAYLARNARLQEAVRQGGELPDLTPDYLGREQYV